VEFQEFHLLLQLVGVGPVIVTLADRDIIAGAGIQAAFQIPGDPQVFLIGQADEPAGKILDVFL